MIIDHRIRDIRISNLNADCAHTNSYKRRHSCIEDVENVCMTINNEVKLVISQKFEVKCYQVKVYHDFAF